MTFFLVLVVLAAVLAVIVGLVEQQQRPMPRPVTLGDARREVQRTHCHHLITWMHQQFVAGAAPQTVFERLAA